MTDLMSIATQKQAEWEHLLCNQQLVQQACAAEQAERSRFLKAYRLRSLLNRIAPILAPHLGF